MVEGGARMSQKTTRWLRWYKQVVTWGLAMASVAALFCLDAGHHSRMLYPRRL